MTTSRREFPRFALEATVELAGPASSARGRTSNVSRGGLSAELDQPLEPGEVVTVRLSLVFDKDTFSEPLDLPARVVWCTPLATSYQVGTSFLPLNAEQRSYLAMFLRYLDEGNLMRKRQAQSPESLSGAAANASPRARSEALPETGTETASDDEEPDPFG